MNFKYIKTKLDTRVIGKEILYFERIDSTNTFLKNLEDFRLMNGLVVCADEQTHGRGRYNRTWYSQAGKNLTFSILLIPPEINFEITLLPILTASAVGLAIEKFANIQLNTKWPNDLLIKDKKFAGILIETSFTEILKKIIIGIGINVNQSIFNREIDSIATSLHIETNKEFNREELLTIILKYIDNMYDKLIRNDYQYYFNYWVNRCYHFGKEIKFEYNGKRISGIAEKLDTDGGLIVNLNNKEIKILSGEILINKER